MSHLKLFLIDSMYLILFSLYTLIELYIYFVFLGIFCIERGSFNTWVILTLFLIFHLLITTKIIFYMQMFITEGRSTLEIFPHAVNHETHDDFKSINPFIVESMLENSIEKIQSCEECMTYKPPRSHHCKRCDRCYLKYDHHCIFLDTCIGFHNYKYFYQFLVTNFISVVYFLLVILFDIVCRDTYPNYLIANYAVATSLYFFEAIVNLTLLILHTQLISRNETSVEYKALNAYIAGDYSYVYVFQEGPIKTFTDTTDRAFLNPYNLGRKQNWIEVFGKVPLEWFRPTFTTMGDGVTFRTNQKEDEYFL